MSVANSSGLFVRAEKSRDSDHTITMGASDGTDVSVATNDNVRLKIGRAGATPVLDLSSAAATSAGSVLTAANPTNLKLVAADLSFKAGLYDLEVSVVDKSDSNRIKHAEKGVFHLIDTMAGAVSGT